MKYKEIQKMGDAEITSLLAEKRESSRSLRFGIAGSKTRNVKEGKNTKKLIARILTEVTRRAKTS